VGAGGYQVGNFPGGWAEWNGKYRDTVRRFWRGDSGQLADLGYRLSGSSDLYDRRGRSPHASVNFITCHDGFTLHDLVSYERKHNETNGHGNQDGTEANWSCNWGVEGPTEALRVRRLREQVKRNFLATLAFSQGVPMLSHGDELSRTQGGNNNAYCQDNEVSWVDWNLDEAARELLAFARRVLALRQANPVFRRRSFFSGRLHDEEGVKDVAWLRADGREMTEPDWRAVETDVLGMLLRGEATDEVDERGRPIKGDTLLLVMNPGDGARLFTLPDIEEPGNWHELVNTARAVGHRVVKVQGVRLGPRSLVLLSHAHAAKGAS
jgi:glycogen operon protein